MKTKICSRCKDKRPKPVSEFCKSSRMKDGYQPACKTCMNDSYTRSRNKKRDHYLNVAKERQGKNVKRFNGWKIQQHCIACLDDDESCLDLHHLDPSKKDATVSDVVRSWSWEHLQEEIDKCVVLCASCHRKVHANKISLLTSTHI